MELPWNCFINMEPSLHPRDDPALQHHLSVTLTSDLQGRDHGMEANWSGDYGMKANWSGDHGMEANWSGDNGMEANWSGDHGMEANLIASKLNRLIFICQRG